MKRDRYGDPIQDEPVSEQASENAHKWITQIRDELLLKLKAKNDTRKEANP